ncbi:CRACD-like protein isoform X2 [Nycticebus coucang]|uniref:CRACD-like protein isoform X2 n=1 Tax=Nycticebus coucang TaxID=9470 RepID=UPI00234C5953|nr:CRACD-like protein isoform X2 [Nycticebus coucang]
MKESEVHARLRKMAALYQCIRPDPSELDMISTRVMDIKLREAAEGLGEDGTGKKKSKFKTFKKFFGKKKRKESPSSTGSSTWKQCQARTEVIAIESGPVGYDSEDELEESRGTLGSRALSHDSIFIPESGQDPARPVRVFSQENVCDRIKALQLKIQCNVKMGPPPPPGVLPTKRGEDAGMSSEDDGLPRSPPEMSLLHDMVHGPTIKVSLVSSTRPLSPDQASDTTVSPRTSDSSLAPVADFSHPPESSSCLDNSAAKHKLLVKPRNQRSSKMRRLSSRAQSESLSDLTWTLEEEECEEKPLPEAVMEESPSSGQQHDIVLDRGPGPGPAITLLQPGGARARRARLQHCQALNTSMEEEGSAPGDKPPSRPATPEATEPMSIPAPCEEWLSLPGGSAHPSPDSENQEEAPSTTGSSPLMADTAEEGGCTSEDFASSLSTDVPAGDMTPPGTIAATALETLAGPEEPHQDVPDQGIPDQNVPDQHGPDQGVPHQDVPDQGIPDQHGPDQGIPHQDVPDQRGPHQDVPGQGGPDQSVPDQRGPDQHGPDQRGPHQDVLDQCGPDQDVPDQGGPHQDVPDQRGPHQDVPDQRGPHQDVLDQDVPDQRGPHQDVLDQDVPDQRGPDQGVPHQRFPDQDVPKEMELKLEVVEPGRAEKASPVAPVPKSCLKRRASAASTGLARSREGSPPGEPGPCAQDREAAPLGLPKAEQMESPQGERAAPERKSERGGAEVRGSKKFSVSSCRLRPRPGSSRLSEHPGAPGGRLPLGRSGPAWRSEAALEDLQGPPEPQSRKPGHQKPAEGASQDAGARVACPATQEPPASEDRSPFPVKLRSTSLSLKYREGSSQEARGIKRYSAEVRLERGLTLPPKDEKCHVGAAPALRGAKSPSDQGKGKARSPEQLSSKPPLPRKPLLQSFTLPHSPAPPDASPGDTEPRKDSRTEKRPLRRGADKGLPPPTTGPGANGQPAPPWITIARQKRRGPPDQPHNQEDKPGARTLKSELGKQAKPPDRTQEPVKQADFVRSKSFLVTPVKPAVDRRRGAELGLQEGLQRGISLSHQNLAQSAVMTEKELHQLKRASYASADQPSWMELARKKSQAWSDMPQIIK